MKYRLKDRDLQARFSAIYPNFEDSLNICLFEQLSTGFGFVTVSVENENGLFDKIHIYKCDLEEIAEYNPHGWNEYPAVIPPEIDTYRVEVFENADESEPTRLAGYWDGKRFLIAQEGGRTRFRPWEDEE